MDLNLEISPSERKIQEEIGKEKWIELRNRTLNKGLYTCDGCDFIPQEGQVLRVHVHAYPQGFELSDRFAELQTSILCDACHTLKHFDLAVQSGLLKLVNSDFTQKDLIAVCRHGNRALNAYLKGSLKIEKRIFPLKKKPEEYLREIMEDRKMYNPKIKAVFTQAFNWDNCR